MANRYLIGTGSRNVSNTAIWSDVSGGTGGFSAPTLGDAVWFDNNSGTGALTLDAATSWGSLDSTGLTGIVTITSAVYTLSLYGSWTIHGTYQKFALTGTAYFYQKGTGTITTNGNLFLALNRLYIDGAGITVTNGDDMTVNGNIYLYNGTYNTNEKNITGLIFRTETGTKTLTIINSIMSFQSWKGGQNKIGLIFNYAGSTIKSLDGFNYGAFTSNTVMNNVEINSHFGVGGIELEFTCENLLITGKYGNNIANGLTVNNTLTITGANATSQRVLIQSNTIGTQRTITCNGTTNITNCDFQDITLAGTANRDFSAQTDIGNCGGNSGITFPPAIDCYIKHTSGAMSVSNVAKWVTTDGGSTQARVPLPQDRAWGKASSFTGASTVTMDCPRIGSIDLSEVNQAVGWTFGNAVSCYGNYVLGNNITQGGNFTLKLLGRGSYTLNAYDKQVYYLVISAPNGTYTLGGNIKIAGIELSWATLNALNYTIEINLYSGNALLINIISGVFNSGTSTFFINPPTISNNLTIIGTGSITFNNVNFSGTHTGNFNITGSNTFNNIKIDAGRKVRCTAGTTQTLLTPLDATGTAAAPITIQGVTAAEFTLNYTGTSYIQCDYLSLTNSKVLPAGKWFAGKNSVNVSGNLNWLFRRYIMMPIITIIRKL